MSISTSTKWLGFADETLVMLQVFNSNVFEESRLHYHRLQTGIPWVKLRLFTPTDCQLIADIKSGEGVCSCTVL